MAEKQNLLIKQAQKGLTPKSEQEEIKGLMKVLLGQAAGTVPLPEEKVSKTQSALQAISNKLLGAQIGGTRTGVSIASPSLPFRSKATDLDKRLAILKALPKSAFGEDGEKLGTGGFAPGVGEPSDEELQTQAERDVFSAEKNAYERSNPGKKFFDNIKDASVSGVFSGKVLERKSELIKSRASLRQKTGTFRMEAR